MTGGILTLAACGALLLMASGDVLADDIHERGDKSRAAIGLKVAGENGLDLQQENAQVGLGSYLVNRSRVQRLPYLAKFCTGPQPLCASTAAGERTRLPGRRTPVLDAGWRFLLPQHHARTGHVDAGRIVGRRFSLRDPDRMRPAGAKLPRPGEMRTSASHALASLQQDDQLGPAGDIRVPARPAACRPRPHPRRRPVHP
jgi:hypothetical protein